MLEKNENQVESLFNRNANRKKRGNNENDEKEKRNGVRADASLSLKSNNI